MARADRAGEDRAAAVLVRPAALGDAGGLGGIAARAWEATYRGIVPDPVLDEWIAGAAEGWRQTLANRPADSPSRAWVAEREGMLLGFATTAPAGDRWLPPPDGAGELTNLYLEPAVIGTGVGRRLYEHAIDDLRARRFDPLVVWAFRDNARARHFYPRMGLEVDVADHAWVLGGIPCPIVRFRGSLAGPSR